FHAALVSEWVTLDAAGGLGFYMKNAPGGTSLPQFVSEWFKADPNGAVNGLMAVTGPEVKTAEGSLRSLVRDMARTVPNRVPEVAERLPKTEAILGNEISDAFATMAGNNLEATRQSAEKIAGPNR